MLDVPLIWTTKGNLPITELEHQVQWQVGTDQIVFTEAYLLDGEVVKKSSHIKVLTGVSMSGAAAI